MGEITGKQECSILRDNGILIGFTLYIINFEYLNLYYFYTGIYIYINRKEGGKKP